VLVAVFASTMANDAQISKPEDDGEADIFSLWNLIIRPPRTRYPQWQLGPQRFEHQGVDVKREDFSVKNHRKQELQCSLFEPQVEELLRPIVIYCHGNSSCRLGALEAVPVLLPMGIALLAFDFAGSGVSDGDFVSLGWHERDDLASVITYLRTRYPNRGIGLWGRSMGAATCVLHMPRESMEPIQACVLDSCFANLAQLAGELAQNDQYMPWPLPSLVLSAALGVVRMMVESKAKFDIMDVSPVDHVGDCTVPTLFLVGQKDDFVRPSHSELLHDKHAGVKELLAFDGDHNSIRPRSAFEAVRQWFLTHFDISPPKCFRKGGCRSPFDFLGVSGVSSQRRTPDGKFCVGDLVEYKSITKGEWIGALIVSVSEDGGVELDVKKNFYLYKQDQETKIRFPTSCKMEQDDRWQVQETVEYYSVTSKEWIKAVVIAVNSHNEVELDVKRGYFLPVQDHHKLRRIGKPACAGFESEYVMGDRVEYMSKSLGGWIEASVVAVDVAGRVQLDCKRGVWFTADEQQSLIRHRGISVEKPGSEQGDTPCDDAFATPLTVATAHEIFPAPKKKS